MRANGFTLLEVLGGLAVIGLIAAVAAIGIRSLVSNSAAQADALLCRTIATDINSLLSQPGFDGFIPITATAGSVPVSGTNLSSMSPTLIQSATCFENVLIAYGVIATPYKFAYLGPRGFEPVPLRYAPTLHAFYTQGDVAPQPGSMTSTPRVLTVLASPGTAPSAARGSNFWLTPGQDQPAGALIFFVYYPQLDAGQAHALAAKLSAPSAVLPAAGQKLDDGPVAYAAADPTTNKTDVFVFIFTR